jgi:hypothetical protein
MASGVSSSALWIALDNQDRVFSSVNNGVDWIITPLNIPNLDYTSRKWQYLPFVDQFIINGRNSLTPILIESDASSFEVGATVVDSDRLGSSGATNTEAWLSVEFSVDTEFRSSIDPSISWVNRANNDSNPGTGKQIAWDGSNHMVASTSTSHLLYSSNNGVLWDRTNDFSVNASERSGIAYGNGEWVLGLDRSTGPHYIYSSDGVNFSPKTVSPNQRMINITYDPKHNRWYAVGDNASKTSILTTQTPSNQASWIEIAGPGSQIVDISTKNGTIIAFDEGGGSFVRFWRSTDGLNFSSSDVTTPGNSSALTIGVNWVGAGPV